MALQGFIIVQYPKLVFKYTIFNTILVFINIIILQF